MSRVLVDINDLDKLRRLEFLQRGKEGSCYFLNKDEIIKLYHIMDTRRKIYFDNLESDVISFPKDIYIYKGTNLISGYTMNYLRGEPFVSGFSKKLLLRDLKKAILDTKDEITKYPDIYMEDMCLVNLLFDYRLKMIKLIDTSMWYKKEDSLEDNIKKINMIMMTSLCRSIDWITYPLMKDKDLHDIYCMHIYGNESLPIEFLELIELKISEINGQDVKTIGDLVRK
ncbi:MAG: hypothetical protein IJ501_05260 [Bacilli bacterium]|nr:hypothetical protein [Bacilli bacterium]